jgi:hypothetical protein
VFLDGNTIHYYYIRRPAVSIHHTPPVLRNVLYDEEENVFLKDIGAGISSMWMEVS